MNMSPVIDSSSQISRSRLKLFFQNVKTQEIALTMLLGVGGVGVGVVGVLGFFKIGALSNLKQLHAIIMMGAGGGGGVTFLILSIICLVKRTEGPKHKVINTKEKLCFC